MTTLNISSELHQALEQLALTEGLAANELAEAVLAGYIDERASLQVTVAPDDEEIAAVLAAISEAEGTEAVWYTHDETTAEIHQFIDDYQPKRKQLHQ